MVTTCFSVYVFVCPQAYLWNCTSDLQQVFMRVACGHGSVLLWRRRNKLCASAGSIDDVVFARNGQE